MKTARYTLGESLDNVMFYHWLQEAMTQGIVTQNKEVIPYIMAPTQYTFVTKTTINKPYIKEKKEFIKGFTYSPDFIFYWNPKYEGILFRHYSEQIYKDNKSCLFLTNKDILGNHFSIVDVKAEQNRFGKSNSDITFPINQKILFKDRGLYVQKIYILSNTSASLFGNVWIPKEFYKDMFYKRDCKNGNKGEKKYIWEYKTIQWYLKNLN